MENFNQIFILENIDLNLDIIETGLINIFLLIGIVIYFSQQNVGPVLKERKETIYKNVEGAETRLIEAEKRVVEAIKQLKQLDLVLNQIKTETIETKIILLETQVIETKKDLNIRFDRAIATFRSRKQKLFLEIKQQIISLVLKRSLLRTKEAFKSNEYTIAVNTEIINKLEGDLRDE
uniref:CF0 subunit I of ATP synthase n=1 Tax=Climaconeis cf. scalaris TaxID=2846828 RepID=A0A8F8SR38_9STRA|nr:CF0 subunit I of ATP synthase [Climaconeis cf. scalaris]QYB19112.1 CF0 subunit I of ATP synthase [Climaconeis cf. scalaris]